MNKITLAMSLVFSSFMAQAATIYTGDKINGVDVISQLDVADLAAGKTHRFLFEGATDGIGQAYYVPVIVAKGAKEGPKLILNSGIHGDEVNGVRTVQKIMAGIDATQLSGTVVAVTGANPNAISHIRRVWTGYTSTGNMVDFNRIFPGKEFGTHQEQHAWKLWNKLWKGNADYAIDFHTQSTGQSYPLFIYADYRNDQIRVMAESFPADQIKKDPGESGTVETTFVEAGIPAITMELGRARAYDYDKIDRSVEGTRNYMIHLKMIGGEIGRTAKTQNSFIGNKTVSTRAEIGGYTEIMVKIGDKVTKGQLIATQLNIFGDVVKEYHAQVDGTVLTVSTDAVRESKAELVRILMQDPAPECKNGC